MGFISISIAVMNLMPIPILDGGQIFILAVEGVIRRDLSMRLKEIISQVGFVMILLLMFVVIWFDLMNLPRRPAAGRVGLPSLRSVSRSRRWPSRSSPVSARGSSARSRGGDRGRGGERPRAQLAAADVGVAVAPLPNGRSDR